MKPVFHVSLPCLNLEKTRSFHTYILGVGCGRETSKWLDVNLFSNQLTYVLVDKFNFDFPSYSFEREALPTFHFGVVLNYDSWIVMKKRIEVNMKIEIVPKTFLKGKSGEHQSFFVKDPNGYTIEFKTFKKENEMFI